MNVVKLLHLLQNHFSAELNGRISFQVNTVNFTTPSPRETEFVKYAEYPTFIGHEAKLIFPFVNKSKYCNCEIILLDKEDMLLPEDEVFPQILQIISDSTSHYRDEKCPVININPTVRSRV